MNVFVSYTRRDGIVTNEMLSHLYDKLKDVCTPFIHALEEQNLRHQQFGVLKAIFFSDIVLVVISPLIYRSPWVRLEILLAKLLMRPILRISATEIADCPNAELITLLQTA